MTNFNFFVDTFYSISANMADINTCLLRRLILPLQPNFLDPHPNQMELTKDEHDMLASDNGLL